MAQKTIHIDDIDGTTEDIQNISFALGKNTYTIDLNPHHRWELEEALKPFITHATKQKTTTKKVSTNDTKAIRQWAAKHGIPVPEKGRIPQHIRNQYTQQTQPNNPNPNQP